MSRMQSRWLCLPAASLFAAFTSCTNTGSTGTAGTGSVGPFDARGNYVEAWADNPSKWRKGSTEIAEAEPDRPAADVPVVPPTVLAANERPKPVETRTTTVYRPKTTTVSNPKPRTGSTASSSSSKPKPKAVVVKPKTKPKPVVKSKPKATRHTVRSGDSLYAIAKRYGTTASAVQRANGLKTTVIRPGQTLTIPK